MGEDIEETKAEPAEKENVTEKKEEVVHDHPVFKTIADGDMETMRNYFEVEGVSLEKEDQHGMTPLMHASWKGKYDIAKYLIKQGLLENFVTINVQCFFASQPKYGSPD